MTYGVFSGKPDAAKRRWTFRSCPGPSIPLCHAIEATLVSSRGQLAPRVHVGVIRGLLSSCAREVYEFVQELTDQGGGGRGRGKKMKMKSKKQDKSKTKGGTKYEVQKDQEVGVSVVD